MKTFFKISVVLIFTLLIQGRFNSFGQSSSAANTLATTKGSVQNTKNSILEAYEFATYIRTAENAVKAKEYLAQLISTLEQAKFIGSSAEQSGNRLNEMSKSMSKIAGDLAAEALADIREANVEINRLLRKSHEADSTDSFDDMKTKMTPVEKSLKELAVTLEGTDHSLQLVQAEIKN